MISYERKLERVLDAMGGLYTVGDLVWAVKEGRMQAFGVNNSVVFTAVQQYPRARKLQVIALAGDLDDGEELHEKVVRYADQENCGLIQAHGRRGWIPNALSHGWRVKAKSWLYQKDM